MLKQRIIPCLDIQNGRTVKGVNFKELRDAGDPCELALRYDNEGADELVFLDIQATLENRPNTYALAERVARQIRIPFTIGGGINSVEDVAQLLEHGADKAAINSAAIRRPALIDELAAQFGSQCITVAIDAKWMGNSWEVYQAGGTKATGLDLLEWAKEVTERGAGEILLTSMDADGTKAGYDLDMLKAVRKCISVPLIASGGAGSKQHFLEALQPDVAHAALAASLFHFNELPIPELKDYLRTNEIPIR